MASSIPPVAVRNQLLAALPPEVLARLLPRMRSFSLSLRDSLIRPDTPIDAVYFVESGWISLVAALDEGTQAEVGLIGREGMAGTPLVIGIETAFVEAFVQADGSALRMEAVAQLCVWKRPPSGMRWRMNRTFETSCFVISKRCTRRRRKRPPAMAATIWSNVWPAGCSWRTIGPMVMSSR
jgi:hypothetical protein